MGPIFLAKMSLISEFSKFKFLSLVYIEQGRSTTATTLTFTTASTTGITWKAKVTQIECSRWSTFPSVFFNWLLDHVIYHKLKKK